MQSKPSLSFYFKVMDVKYLVNTLFGNPRFNLTFLPSEASEGPWTVPLPFKIFFQTILTANGH